MHAVAPLADWYVPAVQLLQALCPLVAANEPGLHAVAVVARAKHRVPAGQPTHAEAPLDDWYVPAIHAAHTLCPVLAAIVPASHGV